MPKSLVLLSKSIKYTFKNEALLDEAFTHKTYAVEHGIPYDNQRLEFLGDAVMQIILTDYLFLKYEDEQEGSLTKMRSALARQKAFAKLALHLNFQDYIRLGIGEKKSGGATRNSTLCDVFEAFIGALYLDAGISTVFKMITPIVSTVFPEPLKLLDVNNPKGLLQEYTQKLPSKPLPKYIVDEKEGPDHDCIYKVSVTIDENIIGEGEGKNRKQAEMAAANNALKNLNK